MTAILFGVLFRTSLGFIYLSQSVFTRCNGLFESAVIQYYTKNVKLTFRFKLHTPQSCHRNTVTPGW